MTATFQPGKTYTARSICDHDCVFAVTVARRTAKTLTTDRGKTLRIGVYDGAEYVMPTGRYSMAPRIRAA